MQQSIDAENQKEQKPQKYITMNEFRDKGYLQEINRLFLHPLGMAFTTIRDNNNGEEFFRGIAITDEVDGYVFRDLTDDQYNKNAAFVQSKQIEIGKERQANLGYVIQPIVNE